MRANPNLSRSIEELGLDTRSKHVLWQNEGLRTLGDLAKLSRAEVLRFDNFGHKSLGRLETKLKEYGIELHGIRHVAMYLGADLEAEMEAWRVKQDLSRSEAIRRLIEKGLRK